MLGLNQCIYIGMYASIDANMHLYLHTCLVVCIYICMHASVFACMFACMHLYLHTCIYICMYASIHACMLCVCFCLCCIGYVYNGWTQPAIPNALPTHIQAPYLVTHRKKELMQSCIPKPLACPKHTPHSRRLVALYFCIMLLFMPQNWKVV